MTRYRYFLLSSVLQFPYSVNVQQYRFLFAPPSPRLFPHSPPYIENPAAAHVAGAACYRPIAFPEVQPSVYEQQSVL